jgi:hypothetical protein
MNENLRIDTASHEGLYRARMTASPEEQKTLAPAEHRAFAREWTKEKPILAAASLAVAIPAYSLAKALGIVKARTPASWLEVTEGYNGIYDGLKIAAEESKSKTLKGISGKLPPKKESKPYPPAITGKRG